MKHVILTYIFFVTILSGIILSCSHSPEQNNQINTENSIWAGENMLIHFNNGKVQFDIESGFKNFIYTSDTLLIQKSALQADTLIIKALSDSILRVITLSTEHFQAKDTLKLRKYQMQDSIRLIYFESNGCFGRCPIQRIEIENDTLKWVGKLFLEKTGRLYIPTKNIESLLSTISKRLDISKITEYKPAYAPIDDNPTYKIGYTCNGNKRELKIGWDSTKELRYLLSYLDNVYKEL